MHVGRLRQRPALLQAVEEDDARPAWKCRACGADLVDWKLLHRRDSTDAAHTFAALQHELIRHHFFHREVDEKAANHAKRKGRHALKDAARDRRRRG